MFADSQNEVVLLLTFQICRTIETISYLFLGYLPTYLCMWSSLGGTSRT